MDAFVSIFLLLIAYEQLTQILELFDSVETVLAVAVWTLVSKFWVFSSADIRFRYVYPYYETPATQGTAQGIRTQGDVIPPKMSSDAAAAAEARIISWLISGVSHCWTLIGHATTTNYKNHNS